MMGIGNTAGVLLCISQTMWERKLCYRNRNTIAVTIISIPPVAHTRIDLLHPLLRACVVPEMMQTVVVLSLALHVRIGKCGIR
jgi:hypothetical protein